MWGWWCPHLCSPESASDTRSAAVQDAPQTLQTNRQIQCEQCRMDTVTLVFDIRCTVQLMTETIRIFISKRGFMFTQLYILKCHQSTKAISFYIKVFLAINGIVMVETYDCKDLNLLPSLNQSKTARLPHKLSYWKNSADRLMPKTPAEVKISCWLTLKLSRMKLHLHAVVKGAAAVLLSSIKHLVSFSFVLVCT